MYQMYKTIFLETWFKPLVILFNVIIIINIILCNNHVIQFFSCKAIKILSLLNSLSLMIL